MNCKTPHLIQRGNVQGREISSRYKVLPVGAVFDICTGERVRITERKCRGWIYSFEIVTSDTPTTHWFP